MSNSQPERSVTLFVDRDTWSGKLDAALVAAGIPFEAHKNHFAHNTPDSDWLREVGQRGWVVVTRDQNIRRKPDELMALREAGVFLFAMTSGNLSAQDTANLVMAAWPKIQELVRITQPPAVFSITRGCEIRLIKR